MKTRFIIPAALLLILSGCGEVNNVDHVHDLTYHSKVNATCTVDGTEAYFECEECHKLFSDEMAENEIASLATIPATGHGDNLHHFDAIPGTCLDVGFKEYYECYACDNYYSDSEGKNQIDSPESAGYGAHTPVFVNRVEGSCDTYDTDEHYECSVCHKLFTDEACKNETKIEDLYTGTLDNHNLTHHEANAVTPFVDGNVEYYECSVCEKKFSDSQGKNALQDNEVKQVSDGWVGFALSYKIGNNSANVSAEYIKTNDEIFDNKNQVMATKVTFKNALAAGQYFIQDTNGADAITYGTNPRVRLIAGEKITYKMYVNNTGVGDLKLSICFNDTNDNSGILVDVKEGESVTLSNSITHYHSSGTKGGWIKVNVLNDVAKGASYESYGYYKSKDYLPFDGINNTFKVEAEATKKVFNVGDKFNTDGLRLRMYENKCTDNIDTGYITSYETNYDGHTFTDSDVGKKTVYVKFGSVVIPYEITVNAYHGKCTSFTHVAGTEATNWSNGFSSYYACNSCDKIYSDANGENQISIDSLKTSKGAWAHFTNYKSLNGSGVSAEYVEVTDKILEGNTKVKATKVKFTSSMSTNGSFDHQNNFDDPAVADRTNTRIPFVSGQKLDLKFYYENTGTSAISFKYRLWDGHSSTEIIQFSLQPGESTIISKTFDNPDKLNNEGGWARYYALSNIEAGAEFISYGFYSTTNNGIFDFTGTGTGHKASLGIKQNATKTTFKVGETFTTDNLILLLKNSLPNQKHGGILIFHFDTNYDGHTFTSSDIGTKTVTVRFADASVTYNIKVEA